jgi:hypothetical protein
MFSAAGMAAGRVGIQEEDMPSNALKNHGLWCGADRLQLGNFGTAFNGLNLFLTSFRSARVQY